ncbi:MAG TPA: hypothetical protein VLE73_06775 [Candidatus Saccharimonadales bacterium]|nr:hypothetical protein [Candidatus Saccharimonadales bacterium]
MLVEPDIDVSSSLLDGADATTYNYSDQSQTVSIISQPESQDGQPGNFNTSKPLATEACQATVDVLPTEDASADPYARSASKRLAQEQLCNSLGLAAQEAGSGQSYESYVKAVAPETKLPFMLNGKTYAISRFTVSQQQYADMQQTLVA